MSFVLLAFAAGVLTVLAPCILPLLPIVLGGTQGGTSRRPLWVVIGFVVSFSAIGAALATAGSFAGIMPETLRLIAVVLLVVLGLLLLFPRLYQFIQVPLERVMAQAGQSLSARAAGRSGVFSGLVTGLAMGLIWTPCAGPVLGSILTLAATTKDAFVTTLLLAAYAVGAAVPMLAIAYLGRGFIAWLKARDKAVVYLNRIFGALLIMAGVAIGTGLDREVQILLLPYLPSFVTL